MPTDKHARRSAQNTKSMNDFLTRKEALALLRNAGLLDAKGEPTFKQFGYSYMDEHIKSWHIHNRLSYRLRAALGADLRRLWARIARRKG